MQESADGHLVRLQARLRSEPHKRNGREECRRLQCVDGPAFRVRAACQCTHPNRVLVALCSLGRANIAEDERGGKEHEDGRRGGRNVEVAERGRRADRGPVERQGYKPCRDLQRDCARGGNLLSGRSLARSPEPHAAEADEWNGAPNPTHAMHAHARGPTHGQAAHSNAQIETNTGAESSTLRC